MTTQPLAAWPKWRDDLILQLQLKNVPGDRIGDILFEIDSHLAESGETPDQRMPSASRSATRHPERLPDLTRTRTIPET
jgi:hypothetical protein